MKQTQPILTVTNLKKSYKIGRRKKEVLRNVNFSINRGEWVAVMGPSGCGKTTLLNLLSLLDRRFDDGKIKIEDRDFKSSLSARKSAFIRSEKFGIVFQHHHMIPHLTVRENVQMPFVWANDKFKQSYIDERTETVINLVGLSDRIDHFPDEVSGGEKQRAAIARALVRKPTILFLDEPTGNLDMKTGKAIIALFQTIVNRGVTTVMVTHDTEAAKQAHRILLLKQGEIVSLTN
ncbi:MAG: ABC transporter ATP-binding protein [Candidatus Hodarchaeales archaeon]|jgi:putative ABC transport system ATP-binding protein